VIPLKHWRFPANIGELVFSVLALSATCVGAQDPPASRSASAQPAATQIEKRKWTRRVSSAPDQPQWDPLRAEKDLEVGKYYMKRGDCGCGIDRFEDATTAKPGFAIPFLYLGEAYEKKGKKKPAVRPTSGTWISIPTPRTATRSARRSKS